MSNFKVNDDDFLNRYITYEEVTGQTLYTWGDSNFGELGLNQSNTSLANRSSPVQVGSQTNWKELSLGGRYSLGIKTDNTLWSWGLNSYGNLGTNNRINRSSPVQIGTDTNWKKISATLGHVLAIKTDGTLWAWGDNFYGNLGTNDAISRSSPVQIGTGTDWKNISCGSESGTLSSFSLAIKENNTLWAWGRNDVGKLGLNDTIDRSSPVQLGTQTNWKEISCDNHVLAIKTDGTLWAWGQNGGGCLGTNDVISRSSPVQIGTGTDWKYVSALPEYSLAVKTNGTLWGWGDNFYGNLGDGTTIYKSSPVQIGSNSNWNYLGQGSVANSFSLAVKTDGTLWAWGFSNQGSTSTGWLGLTSTINRSSPVQVGNLSRWKHVSLGYRHSAGILYTNY